MRYYIDTCIWIDYLEERTSTDIFVECMKNQDTIVTSDFLFVELIKHLDPEKVTMLLSLLEAYNLIEHVEITEEQKQEAKILSDARNVPLGDANHAVLARDYSATILTRDKHFLRLSDICRVKLL